VDDGPFDRNRWIEHLIDFIVVDDQVCTHHEI
jgi:hypothetical protein